MPPNTVRLILADYLNYDTDQYEITHLFAFEAGSEDDRLPDYAMFVKLPDWLPETN